MALAHRSTNGSEIASFSSSNRRDTEEAVSRLAGAGGLENAQWYEPGTDFCFYAGALQTCLASKSRLIKILEPSELRELEATRGVDVVLSKMSDVLKQIEKKSNKSVAEQRTAKFVNGFSDFVVKSGGIVATLLPQSPEYTVTYGIIVLIFQTVVTKKEREETLMQFVRSMADRLPVVDFYKNIFPTYDMKLAVASVYVGLTKLLEDALVYFRGGRLSKLLDAVIRPKDGKFNQQIEDIDRAIERLNSLKTAASIAQQTDMKNMLQDAGHVVARIHQNLEGTTAALGQSMAFLNQKIDAIQARTDRRIYNLLKKLALTPVEELLEFESFKYALSLRQIIDPFVDASTGDTEEYDLRIASSRQYSLTPKDAWEDNGILDDLLEWSMAGRRTLLWIGGSSGNQDPWITPFAIDVIKAFKTQELTLLYVLCDIDSNSLRPSTLVQRLIGQILGQHPQLAFQHPRFFNVHRFRMAAGPDHPPNFDLLWDIFTHLISLIRDVFIIIDRIEEVVPEPDSDIPEIAGEQVQDRLIPRLLALADKDTSAIAESSSLTIVITSVEPAPEELWDDPKLAQVYINTGKPPRKRG